LLPFQPDEPLSLPPGANIASNGVYG